MVKKFSIPCNTANGKTDVTLYIGDPMDGSHPLAFQSDYLSSNKAVNIPADVMESFSKLEDIAEKYRVPLEDLCERVIEELNHSKNLARDYNRGQELSKKKENN